MPIHNRIGRNWKSKYFYINRSQRVVNQLSLSTMHATLEEKNAGSVIKLLLFTALFVYICAKIPLYKLVMI